MPGSSKAVLSFKTLCLEREVSSVIGNHLGTRLTYELAY